MLISDYYPIPVPIALAVVAGVLATSIIASVIHTAHDKKSQDETEPQLF
jgi:hypothetical protein